MLTSCLRRSSPGAVVAWGSSGRLLTLKLPSVTDLGFKTHSKLKLLCLPGQGSLFLRAAKAVVLEGHLYRVMRSPIIQPPACLTSDILNSDVLNCVACFVFRCALPALSAGTQRSKALNSGGKDELQSADAQSIGCPWQDHTYFDFARGA